ncbi:MAG: regulatory protein RecX [Oscillospiraceae bacterium]|nr:regulatory protein RecX [Oscillospiraceae bacterium]
MRIDSLAAKPDRAERYLIRFSDGSTMRLYRQTVEDFGLYPGLEMTDEEVSRLREAAGRMSAKMRAVRIVTASNVSRQDLEERLVRKGEDPGQAREAVQWMTDLDLVDDARTAAQVVSQCARKGYGLARAKQALYEKRIPKELWEDALADYPDQSDSILAFLRSRLTEGWDQRDLKRAVDALLRRGHNYSDIRQCLRQLDADDGPEDGQWQ